MRYCIISPVTSRPLRRIFSHQSPRRVPRDGPLVSLRGLLGRVPSGLLVLVTSRLLVGGVMGQNSLRGVGGS